MMRFSGRRFGWLLPLILACFPAAAAGRVEVPLNQRVLTDGTIRYFVNVSIGGRSIAAMVDTGSTGLRILPNVIPDSAFVAISNQANVYGYGSGVRLNGLVATLRTSLGSSAVAPIPVQLVRTVDCFPKQPKCPASHLSQADYRIGGDGLAKQGFDAILGIALGTGVVDNPLRALGAKTWIVMLPRPGDRTSGVLILDPDASEAADYTLFPTHQLLKDGSLGAPDSLPGCLVIEKSGKQICGPTLLDTGAPGVSISSGNPADVGGWKRGDQLAIAFTNRRGGTVQAAFQAGAMRPAQISASLSNNAGQTAHIAAGTLPYFLFSVLYDDPRRLIGLKTR